MAVNYYIKAYLTKPNQQQEIRRFGIDISPNNDAYNELKTKITSYLSDNQLKDFILQYSDEENEQITFSSNDELRSAIDLNKDAKTLKVFVVFKQPTAEQQQQQQDSTNKDCHVGVECDNCHGPVIGFRYKCFVCPNYDLCEKCSSAGAHPEHNMIRITKPGSFQPLDEHYRRHFFEHHNRHHHGPPPPPPPPPPPSIVPSQEYLQKLQSQIPHWLPNPQHTAHFRAHVQQHVDALKSKSQTQVQVTKQYLESVGQYLQKALTPLGIDCEYHVDSEKLTTQQQQEQRQEEQQQPQQDSASASSTASTPNTSVVSSTSESTEIDNTQEQRASSTIPEVEESTKIRDPLEHAIDNCMEQMTAMGFMDANGALRELIRSKEGDMNAVLDAINPRFRT